MQLVAQQEVLKKKRNKIHPFKYALWVGCASILMMFLAMTSAYLVRQAGGNWLEFTLPNLFYYNTVVILLSSVTMHSAFLSFKKKQFNQYKILLGVTAILGTTFVVLQYMGWEALIAQGIELKTNPSSSFLYVISGLHAFHVLPGIVAILLTMVFALLKKSKVEPTPKKRRLSILRLELITHYWHFVDFLWVYLLFFLLTQ